MGRNLREWWKQVTIQGAAVDNKILNNRIGLIGMEFLGNEGHGVIFMMRGVQKVGEPAHGNWISANGKWDFRHRKC